MHALFWAIMILNPLALFFLNYNPVIVQKFFISKTGDFSQFCAKNSSHIFHFFLYFALLTVIMICTSYNAWQHFLEWFVLFIISATIIYNHRFIFQKKPDTQTSKLEDKWTHVLLFGKLLINVAQIEHTNDAGHSHRIQLPCAILTACS